MDKKKWTKGPWAISPTGPRYSINQFTGEECACSKHVAMVSCYVIHEGDMEENAANANLIKEAPMLYEALDNLIFEIENHSICSLALSHAISGAKDVLRNAKGEF